MKKIKNILLLLFLVVVTNNAFSQLIKFRKVIGNTGYDVGMSAQQTKDTGYVAFGSTSSFGSGTSDFYLVKTNKFGVPQWHQMYGGINIDKGTCIKETSDKGFIMAGYTNSFGAGGYDAYLVKTDSFGVIQWTHTYGGSDWDFANCVAQTNDGGYIICGSTYSYGKGDEDYYLIKTNSAGDTLWTKTYGGANEDVAKSVIETSDGGYALTGYTKSMGDTDGDFFTVKTNATGDTLWTNKFGGPLLDYANDIIENSVGGYTVGGETKSFGSGNSDAILIYIYPAGNTDAFQYIVGGTGDETVESIIERSDKRTAMVGRTYSWGYANGNADIYIIILNFDWSYYNGTTFGSLDHETVNSVENTNDKGFILCGSTDGFNNKLDDFYLVKTDTNGYSTSSESVFLTNIQTVSAQNNFDFHIAPNPSNSTTHVNITSSSKKISVSLYTIIGELLSKEEVENNSGSLSIPINTNDLPEGIYLLKVETDRSVHTKKIVVKH
jgi:hypothetical protein